jgi:hypothetical protein
MKVLNRVSPETWKHRHICAGCGSELEVEAKDIRFANGHKEPYYVECPVCQYADTVSKAFVPEDIRIHICESYKRINTQ